jgi:hypothetical protein
MSVSLPGKVCVALLVAGSLCACAAPVNKNESVQPVSRPTYKPTGSHIVERSDGKRSPKNSSSAPVRDLEDSPAVTVIQNQPPK